jgi:hypothetical protein
LDAKEQRSLDGARNGNPSDALTFFQLRQNAEYERYSFEKLEELL